MSLGKLSPEQYQFFSSDMIEEHASVISLHFKVFQFLPRFSHTNLCVTNFYLNTLMFHKGQGSLCVWIQLDKGTPKGDYEDREDAGWTM